MRRALAALALILLGAAAWWSATSSHDVDPGNCPASVDFGGLTYTSNVIGAGRYSVESLEATEELELDRNLGEGTAPACDESQRPTASTQGVEVWGITGIDPAEAVALPDVSPTRIFVLDSLGTIVLLPDDVKELTG